MAERADGVWELVDGLQRLSTVFEFMGTLRDADGKLVPPLSLSFSAKDDHKLPKLEGMLFESMSLPSRLTLKRTYCRVEVIKIGSAPAMKYDVFERLNTGGARLEHQEVRNAIFRATDPEFMKFCDTLATYPSFAQNLELSEYQQSSMYDRGLVLRFFTLKNNYAAFSHDVEPFVTNYIKKVISRRVDFNRDEEQSVFQQTFDRVAASQGSDAWKHLSNDKPQGAFSVYLFDAISIGVARNLDNVEILTPRELAQRCTELKKDPDFRKNIGSGANTGAKMRARLDIAARIIGT